MTGLSAAVWPGGRAIAQLVDIPPRAADTKEPVVMVGAAPADGAGSSGAVGGANRTRVLAFEVGMPGMASAYALATPAAKPSTARRLKSGMGDIMPWRFG